MNRLFTLLDGVVFRQIDHQYLVYSSLSRETLVVHELAYRILQYLEQSPVTTEELKSLLEPEHLTTTAEHEKKYFVDKTLEQFCRLGIVETV